MYKVVLLRHGESLWNKENLFTGWTDVDLSEKGIAEAHNAAKLLKEGDIVLISHSLRCLNGLSAHYGSSLKIWT